MAAQISSFARVKIARLKMKPFISLSASESVFFFMMNLGDTDILLVHARKLSGQSF